MAIRRNIDGYGAFLLGVNAVKKMVAGVAVAKGFRSAEGLVEVEIARMHQELSYVLDTYSKGNRKSRYISKFTRRDEALANLVIRALDFADRYHIPLGEAILAKLDHNKSRPPKGRHDDGKKGIPS